MGVMVGILATVVIVVMALACCISRHRKSNRVLSRGDIGAVEGPGGAFTNPIYETSLPTYEEIGGIILQEKKVLPYEEPAYETMSEVKTDLTAYMHENRGFVSAEEEKRELESKYAYS